MDKNNFKYDYKILEVSENASFQDIKASYLHLKNLYSSNSRIFSSFTDDTIEKKKEILKEIEKSYLKLKSYFESNERTKSLETEQRVKENKIPEFEKYSGDSLRIIREVLDIEIEEVAFATGISLAHLKAIEQENFELLPPKAYIKAFVRKYAEFLSLDPIKVSNDYINIIDERK